MWLGAARSWALCKQLVFIVRSLGLLVYVFLGGRQSPRELETVTFPIRQRRLLGAMSYPVGKAATLGGNVR
jgi:hypothetical protein